MELTITIEQYLIIKAMLAVASKDKTRPTLGMVHYNATQYRLEATDGHILRVEDITLPVDKNILFRPEDLTFTLPQIKKMRGTKVMLFEPMVVNYIEATEAPSPYPDVERAIPTATISLEFDGVPMIGLDFAKYKQFLDSFHEDGSVFAMAFTKELGATLIYKEGEFKGMIMPCKINKQPVSY